MQKFPAIAFLFITLCAVFPTTAAQAHAHLTQSVPAAGATVAAAPEQVSLTFTENLEPAFSTVEVTDGSGARVDTGKAAVSGNTMQVGLKAGAPGTYHVKWHVVSVDTHTTQGSFTFHVGGP